MRVVLGEWWAAVRSSGVILAWAGLTGAAAFGGPFGTYLTQPLGRRVLVWAVLMAAALAAGLALHLALRHLRPGLGRRGGVVLVAAVATVVLTPAIAALAPVPPDPRSPPSLSEIAGAVFFLSLLPGALVSFPPTVPARPSPAAGPTSDPAGGPRLLRRLDPALRGRLLSISVRDHYVDVVTESGRSSLLMRLSDAVAEAEGEPGLRVHRSHWVARQAARRLERQGDRLVLELSDGSRLPVSRANRDAVAAWLEPAGEVSKA